MAGEFEITSPSFDQYTHEIVNVTLRDGGSVSNVRTRQFLPPLDVWRFPKYPNKTVILPSDTDLLISIRNFIKIHENFLYEPDCSLGTWIHPQTHEYYLDISTSCTDLEEAKSLANQYSERDGRKIVALYNSKRKETVFL